MQDEEQKRSLNDEMPTWQSWAPVLKPDASDREVSGDSACLSGSSSGWPTDDAATVGAGRTSSDVDGDSAAAEDAAQFSDNPDFSSSENGPQSVDGAAVLNGGKPQIAPYALVAFVLAFCSCTCSCLTAIPALILAILAFRQIDDSNGLYTGRGFAKASIIISILQMIGHVIYAVFSVAVNMLASDSEEFQQILERL